MLSRLNAAINRANQAIQGFQPFCLASLTNED